MPVIITGSFKREAFTGFGIETIYRQKWMGWRGNEHEIVGDGLPAAALRLAHEGPPSPWFEMGGVISDRITFTIPTTALILDVLAIPSNAWFEGSGVIGDRTTFTIPTTALVLDTYAILPNAWFDTYTGNATTKSGSIAPTTSRFETSISSDGQLWFGTYSGTVTSKTSIKPPTTAVMQSV